MPPTPAPTTTTVPERSPEQCMQALDRANAIRGYRSRLKRDLKAGRADILTVLAKQDDRLASMKAFDLLLAVPRLGSVRAGDLLRQTKISPSKTIGGLTERQGDALIAALRNRRARPTLFEDRPVPRPERPRTAARPRCERCRTPLLSESDDGLCGFCADERAGQRIAA